METLSLRELTTFIRRVFALNLPDAVWISAELGQVSESRGHRWLTLVEKAEHDDGITAQLDAVIWGGTYKKLLRAHDRKTLAGVLQEGMSVRLRVTAAFHERYGLKLIVEDVDPAHTLGALELRRQATLERLAADTLLDRNARAPLPPLLQRLAVISAETAAGWADFRRQLQENDYGYAFRLELFPAAMQGIQTAEEVMTRLRQIHRRAADFDAVVVVRGGGAKTDLAAFDDEALCRALAAARLPVLSGIGHETDDTVADRLVHRSLKTPTAVAAFLIEHSLRAEGRLLYLGRSMGEQVKSTLLREGERLERLRSGIDRGSAFNVQAQHLRTVARKEKLHALVQGNLRLAASKLERQAALLDALRPETTLARGYAMVSQQGQLISDPAQLRSGAVDIRLRHGRVRLHKE